MTRSGNTYCRRSAYAAVLMSVVPAACSVTAVPRVMAMCIDRSGLPRQERARARLVQGLTQDILIASSRDSAGRTIA
jgi:hypothetical protein